MLYNILDIFPFRRLHDLKNEELTDAQRENFLGSSIVRSINRILNNTLAHQNPHIRNNEV